MINFHSHRERRLSVPECRWIVIGTRLIRNDILTVFVMEVGVFLNLSDRIGRMMGVNRVVRVSSIMVLRISERSITFTWICTKMSGS